MGIPLNIDWQQILLHVFNFVILVGGLYFLLYNPIRKFIAKREEHYRKLDDLYQRLDEFFDINNTDAIPQDSVIREFIGPKQTQDQADA